MIEEFIYAIDKLYKDYPHYRNRIEFQQYGEFQKSDLKLIRKLGLSDTFVINSKLDYEDYMRALDGCDYLLILDTILKDDEIQPYLPSKILEYSLLKKNTLSITTKTSPLYRICKNSKCR